MVSLTTTAVPSAGTRFTPVSIGFNVIQTFFADQEAVNGASEVLLTSIDLFVKNKPDVSLNTSGSIAPGLILSICDVAGSDPNPSKIVEGSMIRVPYDRVFAFSDASVPTRFAFKTPIAVTTGRFYGIMVSFEDAGYQFWVNKTGDRLVGTNTPSPGSNNTKDGKYYVTTNAARYTAINDTDLKYRVNVAKFESNTATIDLVNKNYEFLSVTARNGLFLGGELVYQSTANATGNIAVSQGNNIIVGTNTDFTSLSEGNYIVAVSGSNSYILQVRSVTNTTYMETRTTPSFSNTAARFRLAPVAKVYYSDYLNDKLYLVDSSANSTVNFTASGGLIAPTSGANATIASIDAFVIDKFVPKCTVSAGANTTVDMNFALSANVSGNYVIQGFSPLALNKINEVKNYAGLLVSRSLEVSNAGLFGTDRKSGVFELTIDVDSTGDGLYEVIRINTGEVDFFIQQNQINNTYANTTFDTEVYKNGLARSKGISAKFAFANNRLAEDLRIYANVYRPQGSDIRVYSKIHNSQDPETFDDKLWTPMFPIQNANVYSSTTDKDDLVEIEFALPKYPVSANALPGSFTTTLTSATLVGNGVVPSTYVSANDMVKLYNPLTPDNYMVAPVASSNATHIVLSTEVANNNLVGSGFVVDRLRDKGTAFVNGINGNVATYYTTTLTEVAKFDSMQFKIVFLANNTSIVPEVADFRAIGVNAGT